MYILIIHDNLRVTVKMEMLIKLILWVMTSSTRIQALTLTSSHTDVLPFTTTDVTLNCQLSEADDPDFFAVSSVRILKFQWELMVWRPVAEMRDNEQSARVFGDSYTLVTGGVAHTDLMHAGIKADESTRGWLDAFLKVTWKMANNQTAGRYRCDVTAFTHAYEVVWEKSSVVELKESNPMMTRDLYEMFLKQKTETTKILDKQQAEVDDMRELADNQTRQLKEIVSDLKQKMSAMRNVQLVLTGFLEFWPEGAYGLAMPVEGCPADRGVSWDTGYRKLHTESRDRNNDRLSEVSHLQTPSLERDDRDNFVYQHFCMVAERSVGPLWPRGSYCIAKHNQTSCPPGFSSGYIYWDGEDTDNKAATSGEVPAGNYTTHGTRIYYCCRSDGPAETPVYLPKSKPFYLYRYNGACQSVSDMEVSEEFIFFDTENSDNRNSVHSAHPDGEFNVNIRLELCYYTPN